MRPRHLAEVLGQPQLLGEGAVLRGLLDRDRLPSMILWGPPGSGKTTLARLLAGHTRAPFVALSAVTAGVAEVRKVAFEARARGAAGTLLFLDEIHRFNRAQQDVILPHIEEGTVTLVGATTENPSFHVVAPLLSRCRVFLLKPLDAGSIRALVDRALKDPERGLGELQVEIEEGGLEALAEAAGGDARFALNTLEQWVGSTRPDQDGRRRLTLSRLAQTLGGARIRHDRAGDGHYDVISALIKSIRASDPDAALYWLARLLEAGEDPMFVARRLVIQAAEDVGLADPRALQVAVAAQQAAHFVGMPEGFYPLAEAALYLATAPKSRTVGEAYQRAVQALSRDPSAPVPLWLRNAPTALARSLGHGQAPPGGGLAGQGPGCLPEGLAGQRFYSPGDLGYEKRLADWRAGLGPRARTEPGSKPRGPLEVGDQAELDRLPPA